MLHSDPSIILSLERYPPPPNPPLTPFRPIGLKPVNDDNKTQTLDPNALYFDVFYCILFLSPAGHF